MNGFTILAYRTFKYQQNSLFLHLYAWVVCHPFWFTSYLSVGFKLSPDGSFTGLFLPEFLQGGTTKMFVSLDLSHYDVIVASKANQYLNTTLQLPIVYWAILYYTMLYCGIHEAGFHGFQLHREFCPLHCPAASYPACTALITLSESMLLGHWSGPSPTTS